MKPRRARWRRRVLCGFLAAGLLGMTGCYFRRDAILTAMTRAWVIDEEPVQADAILILSGGSDRRVALGAELFRQKWAPKILITDAMPSPAAVAAHLPSQVAHRLQLLTEKERVPVDEIEVIGQRVTSTRQEAIALREWIMRSDRHSPTILISTDPLHGRRARWIFRRAIKQTDARIRVVTTTPPSSREAGWFETDAAHRELEREILKFTLYFLVYR